VIVHLAYDDLMSSFDEDRWSEFLAWEVEACQSPVALDGGTHIVVALQRT
jgi:hypothetical protein